MPLKHRWGQPVRNQILAFLFWQMLHSISPVCIHLEPFGVGGCIIFHDGYVEYGALQEIENQLGNLIQIQDFFDIIVETCYIFDSDD